MKPNRDPIPVGIALREAVKLARKLGGAVTPQHKTGELLFVHPSTSERVRVNGRRKDTPRALVVWLRSIHETVAA